MSLSEDLKKKNYSLEELLCTSKAWSHPWVDGPLERAYPFIGVLEFTGAEFVALHLQE